MRPRTGDTRPRLLRTAAELFRRQGYHGTGLAQILERSGVPRGSLYFHFPDGKRQLAVEAVGEAGRTIGQGIEAILDSTPDTGEAVTRVLELLAADLRASGYDHGCPVGTVAMDSAPVSEPVRVACEAIFAEWTASIERHLRTAGHPREVAASRALLAVAAIEGALLLARARRDAAALEAVAATLRPLLAPATSKSRKPDRKERR